MIHFLTPTLLYGVETWGPSLNKANNWKGLQRPLVSMIARVMRSKESVLYDVIRAENYAASILTEALLQSATIIQWLWELIVGPHVEHGDIHCWYAEMQQWFEIS